MFEVIELVSKDVQSMMPFDDVLKELGDKLRKAREGKRWSYADVADEIEKLSAVVSAKTVENIEKADTSPELVKVYWIARVLGLSLGEVLEFTLDEDDKRAYAQLSALLRRGGEVRTHVTETLKFLASK